MVYVFSEPIPELKPSKEQFERIARARNPIILEYYYIQDKIDNN
jgi:hypothetical protein